MESPFGGVGGWVLVYDIFDQVFILHFLIQLIIHLLVIGDQSDVLEPEQLNQKIQRNILPLDSLHVLFLGLHQAIRGHIQLLLLNLWAQLVLSSVDRCPLTN